ncbi:MAG: transcriptional repressor [Acidobacteriota bacterium]|nr:transcriptional repressor [Acidobacteriota bacterium]
MGAARKISEEMEIFSKYLKERGLRMTHQRRKVVQSFLQTSGHVSIDELHQLVKQSDRRIGAATVFRTLKALTACGLAREVDLHDGRTRFEPQYKRPHHHHMVCVKCQGTIEFLSPELEQVQSRIVSNYGFNPVQHQLQIFGVCEECQNKVEAHLEPVRSDLVFARDALRIAIATEKRGVNFYSTASELVSHASTKSTFLRMLEDEESHLKQLQAQWDRLVADDERVLNAPVFLDFDFDTLKRIFPGKDQIKAQLRDNLTAAEALKIAMKMEKDAYDFFHDYADKFEDTQGKEIFMKFAEEEWEHFTEIRREYEALS